MDNVQTLKEKARALELGGDLGAALDLYAQAAEESGAEPTVGLWTRMAELQLRLDQVEQAVASYERAIDGLAAEGLVNGALALCRRALRVTPERESLLLRLAELSAAQGYAVDAREAFTSYAQRMEERGWDDAAVDALSAAVSRLPADAVAGQLLVDALRATGRTGEAEAQLAKLESRQRSAPPPAGTPRAEVDAGDELPIIGSGLTGGDEADAGDLQLPPLLTDRADAAEGVLPTALGDARAEEPADVAPLEGLETMHAGMGDWEDDAAEEESLPLLDANFAADEPEEPEESEAEPLPLFGYDAPAGGTSAPPAEAPEERPAAEPEVQTEPTPPLRAPVASHPEKEYVDLGALIFSDDEDEAARFQVAAGEPSGDEDRDFSEILGHFRQQVSERIGPQDATSHYDLGLAFKEMGLLDDAIAQLQMALRGGAQPLATLEVLGECFVEKGEHALALRVLERATKLHDVAEADLVGVQYWLARSQEALGSAQEARERYERVVAADIGFRDAAARLEALRSG